MTKKPRKSFANELDKDSEMHFLKNLISGHSDKRATKKMHKLPRKIRLVLVPVIAVLWFFGWLLISLGSMHKQRSAA